MTSQAIVRDAAGDLVTNQQVGMQISILQTTATGTAVYVETHTETTNSNGLLTLQVGAGSVQNGTFASIDWSAGPYFVKAETDPAGGSNYTITGTQQMASVPYALYAKTSGAGNISNAPNLNDRSIIGFEFSALWICPSGVTEIMVQLWGGAGGAGSGSIPGLCSPCFSCSPTSSVAVGRPGGPGGFGGYNQQLLNVTPGTVYMITIGSGGQGGAPVTVAHGVCSGLNGNNGNPGNTTSFGSILLAEAGLGGSGGQYNYDLQINTTGVAGVSGSVVNYDNNSITTSSPNQSSNRSFIPAGYTQNPVFPSCCSIKGSSGSSGKNGPITGPVMGSPGGNGENGYCIISY